MNLKRITRLTSRLIIAFILLPVVTSFSQSLDGKKFAAVIKALASNGLGVNEYQEYVDLEVRHEKNDLNGRSVVESVASSLSAKFMEWTKAVERLRDVLERGYVDMTARPSLPECCTAPLKEKDVRFRNKVNKDEICTTGEGLKKESVNYINRDEVMKTMKENVGTAPSLKWQYFASEEGVLFNYPTLKYCSDTYDPRFRPFYVAVASPQSKDLVLVVDTSGSMRTIHQGHSLMEIAIEATSTVVDTLGPNDRVGVVSFSGSPQTPPGTASTSTCYSDKLAMATPTNKRYLIKRFLKNLKEGGATNYGAALKKAFQYFTNTADNRTASGQEREKLIVFLTDGAPTDTVTSIMKTLREENAKLGNKVIMFTFGLGEGTSWQTLKVMAEQTTADENAGEVKMFNLPGRGFRQRITSTSSVPMTLNDESLYQPGYFLEVNEPSDLRSKMGLYYTYISKTGSQPKVIFSVPYKDYFGLGVLISGCLPVYHNGQLKGVVCIDRTVSDLLSYVTYFNKGELNYAFVLDGEARVLTHPLLPRPQTIRDDPLFIRLTSLERSSQAVDVMTSMIRGESGNMIFTSERVVSRGNTRLEGVQTHNVQSTYFWAPVGQTRFSVCVVLVDSANTFTDIWESSDLPRSFIYHRLDLRHQLNQCSYLNRVALKEKTAVKFAPTAFIDPYEYLDTEETETTVDRYELYMTGKTSPVDTYFKEGVRESVATTFQLEYILDTRLARYAIWRYIGTEAGVFRKYPGTRMVKEFDHTQRPWYKRGLSLKGLVTFSTPYTDASGSGTILTLSQSIYQGRTTGQHNNSDPVTAVMGMDFTLPYLYYRMLATYPACSAPEHRCFLVDSSGFIVLHKDFVKDSSSTESLSDSMVHISTKETLIARDLVARNVMKKAACVSVQEFSNQYFWRISLQSIHDGHVSSSSYALTAVPGSNIFVVIATGSSSGPPRDCRWCDGRNHLPLCSRAPCHCPCYSPTDIYKYCKDTFSLHADGWPVCVPQSAVVRLEDLRSEENKTISKLANCFSYSCHANANMSACVSAPGCTWCTPHGVPGKLIVSGGSRRHQPYCTGQDPCEEITPQVHGEGIKGGAVGKNRSTDGPEPISGEGGDANANANSSASASGSKVSVILPAVFVPILVIAVVAVGVWMYRRKRLPDLTPTTQPTSHSNGGFQMDARPPPTAPPHDDDMPLPYTAATSGHLS